MKRKRSKKLLIFLFVIASLGMIYGAASYTSARIEMNASLKIVPSENALIAIPSFTSDNGSSALKAKTIKSTSADNIWLEVKKGNTASKGIKIKNDLDKTIVISTSCEDKSGIKVKVYDQTGKNAAIPAGIEKSIMVDIDAKNVSQTGMYNLDVTFNVVWDGGNSKIQKMIPVKVNPAERPVIVKLCNGGNMPLQDAEVYYSINNFSKPVGKTRADGNFTMNVPFEYSNLGIKIKYKDIMSQEVQQDISKNNSFTFNTLEVKAVIKDADGKAIPNGEIRFDSEEGPLFGTTDENGEVKQQILPKAYKLVAKINGTISNVVTNDISKNCEYSFQTIRSAVILKDSNGKPIKGGEVTLFTNDDLKDGQLIGTTDDNGEVNFDCFSGIYTFRIKYDDKILKIKQNIKSPVDFVIAE